MAHGYFDRVLAEVGGGTAAVAESHALHAGTGRTGADLVALLNAVARREGWTSSTCERRRALLVTDAGAVSDRAGGAYLPAHAPAQRKHRDTGA